MICLAQSKYTEAEDLNERALGHPREGLWQDACTSLALAIG